MIDCVMHNAVEDHSYILQYLWHFGVILALAQHMFIVVVIVESVQDSDCRIWQAIFLYLYIQWHVEQAHYSEMTFRTEGLCQLVTKWQR